MQEQTEHLPYVQKQLKQCSIICCVVVGPKDAGGSWSVLVASVYTYTVLATSPCTVNATATVTVTQQALPNAGTNGTLTVCAGTTQAILNYLLSWIRTPATNGTWSNVGWFILIQ
jgi:hypothetical protein